MSDDLQFESFKDAFNRQYLGIRLTAENLRDVARWFSFVYVESPLCHHTAAETFKPYIAHAKDYDKPLATAGDWAVQRVADGAVSFMSYVNHDMLLVSTKDESEPEKSTAAQQTSLVRHSFSRAAKKRQDTEYYEGIFFETGEMGPQLAEYFGLTYRGPGPAYNNWTLHDHGHDVVDSSIMEGWAAPGRWILKKNHPAARPFFVTQVNMAEHFRYHGIIKD